MPKPLTPLLEEAIEALKQDQRTRARDVLTRLLKANQNSVTYWIWMSAAVDTLKERVYCLETVLKLDPRNETARRGLILHGRAAARQERQTLPHWQDAAMGGQTAARSSRAPGSGGLPAFLAQPGHAHGRRPHDRCAAHRVLFSSSA